MSLVWHKSLNKAFKSDSPRLAFLVWVKFSVYGGLVTFRGSVAHTLMRRYVLLAMLKLKRTY
ncbi:hypothetical protein I7103_004871 [Vibrio parahaemolyticus]|nr:hypothetical protein [Vibrio parahaemolyticus]